MRLLPPRWLLLSLLAHGLIISFAKGLPTQTPPLPKLELRLALPKPAPLAPVVMASPSQPRAKPAIRPTPVLTHQDSAEPAAVRVPPAEQAAPPAPAAAPALASRLPAAPAAMPPLDTNANFRADLAGYGSALAHWLAQHRSYPRLAQMRGWQGQVEVRVHVAKKGSVIDIVVTRSSGFEVLDRQAVDMVRLADPLPDLPNSLKGQEFTLDVPVNFRLEQS